jgi:hypothetical protein
VNKNVYHHHLGTIRYDAKKMIWQEEERATAEAGPPIEYEGLNEGTRDYLKAHKLNWSH